ncbi:hypothetical protein EVG20_g11249 [Dentipellis fragilis]|uniref:Uncharacterized protein n=1 Tax=Dentipellis fragilis TaxID=205917 RepID=A0A4Y9XQW9_9AGAM|nr:hypothetical protein EVG20_g11249 [Dentipellis fragilis]
MLGPASSITQLTVTSTKPILYCSHPETRTRYRRVGLLRAAAMLKTQHVSSSILTDEMKAYQSRHSCSLMHVLDPRYWTGLQAGLEAILSAAESYACPLSDSFFSTCVCAAMSGSSPAASDLLSPNLAIRRRTALWGHATTRSYGRITLFFARLLAMVSPSSTSVDKSREAAKMAFLCFPQAEEPDTQTQAGIASAVPVVSHPGRLQGYLDARLALWQLLAVGLGLATSSMFDPYPERGEENLTFRKTILLHFRHRASNAALYDTNAEDATATSARGNGEASKHSLLRSFSSEGHIEIRRSAVKIKRLEAFLPFIRSAEARSLERSPFRRALSKLAQRRVRRHVAVDPTDGLGETCKRVSKPVAGGRCRHRMFQGPIPQISSLRFRSNEGGLDSLRARRLAEDTRRRLGTGAHPVATSV